MALWVVRAGSKGQREDYVLESGHLVIGWGWLGDLSDCTRQAELGERLKEARPDAPTARRANWSGQIWSFLSRMEQSDLVAMPLKSRPAIAIGEVNGPYVYKNSGDVDFVHHRPVRWLKELPRNRFDQDLLLALNQMKTVAQVHLKSAEDRIRELLSGKSPPRIVPPHNGQDTNGEEGPESLDIERWTLDQIRDHIGRNFKSHELSELVGDVLRAQGFSVEVSPAGPDGGIDVVAGRGNLGFDPPRLAVQVKSGETPCDVKVVRELRGAMQAFNATHGLFVSWGGFKSSVLKEQRQQFFEIRLWDATDLVEAVLENYEQLTDTHQAEIPLKRVWALVEEE